MLLPLALVRGVMGWVEDAGFHVFLKTRGSGGECKSSPIGHSKPTSYFIGIYRGFFSSAFFFFF